MRSQSRLMMKILRKIEIFLISETLEIFEITNFSKKSKNMFFRNFHRDWAKNEISENVRAFEFIDKKKN